MENTIGHTATSNASADYVADLIPYRCPKCGGRQRFATLRELKLHIESNHAFKPSRARPAIFREDKNKESQKREPKSEHNFVIKSERFFANRHDDVTKWPENSLDSDRTSPLLQSYKDDATFLEMELQMSKQNEMRHKTENLRALSGNTVNSDFKSTLDALSSEVVKSRRQQWDTADALYKSHDVMNGLELAAENKCQEQRDIIHQLINGMKVKDHELKVATKEQNELKNEQERLYQETEELFRRADLHNESLKRELRNRNGALESLNSELKRMRMKSSQDLQLKENELKAASQRMNRLQSERDELIKETELILKRADADSEELRMVLAMKENKLREVNAELREMRTEKQAILLKTIDFYKKAEEGNDIMRRLIQAKDDQLEQALDQLEKMKLIQKRLVEESENLTDQADDNTTRMRAMLESKEQEVKETVQQLENLKQEKRSLELKTSTLNERAESSVSDIEKLQGKVDSKEGELKATRGQLRELKSFLKNAAEKERTARAKLEKFIGELINRAEKAETELRSLKSQSSSSSGKDYLPADTVTNQTEVYRKNSTEDSKEIQRIPPTISPRKPVRKKLTPSKPVRRKYNHGQKLAHGIVDLGKDFWQDNIVQIPETTYKPIQTDIRNTVDELPYVDHTFDRSSGTQKAENVNLVDNRNIKTVSAEVHQSDLVDKNTQSNYDGTIVTNNSTENDFNANHTQQTVHKPAYRLKAVADQSEETSVTGQAEKMNSISYRPKYKIKERIIYRPKVNTGVTNSEDMQCDFNRLHDNSARNDYVTDMPHDDVVPNNPLVLKRSVLEHEKAMSERHYSPEYGMYYMPQPPLRVPSEFRAPPYGIESTHSVNSIPRVPLHLKTLSHEAYGDLFSQDNRTSGYKSSDMAFLTQDQKPIRKVNQKVQTFPRRHQHRQASQKLAPVSITFREDQAARVPTDLEDLPMSYNRKYMAYPHIIYQHHARDQMNDFSDDLNNGKSNSKQMDIDRRKEQDQVQYEELHDDEDEFPDELYLIPQSASEEMKPELLTPERERKRLPSKGDKENSGIGASPMPRKYIPEKSDVSFDKIMDDNGILWDDMDTLPEVSDSELDELEDRISPSGSEAISTKKQPNAPAITKPKDNVVLERSPFLKHKSEKQKYVVKDEKIDTFYDKSEEADAAIGLPMNLNDRKEDPINLSLEQITEAKQSHENRLRNGICDEDSSQKEAHVGEHAVQDHYHYVKDNSGHTRSTGGIISSSGLFKPISVANSGKSSPSERDLTSGGKEIHDLMTKTAIVNISRSPHLTSDESHKVESQPNNIKSRSCVDSELKDRKSFLFEEKLREISEKYRLKRFDSERTEDKDRLRSISDKYRERRKEILENIETCCYKNKTPIKTSQYVKHTDTRPMPLPKELGEDSKPYLLEKGVLSHAPYPDVQNLTQDGASNIKSNGLQDKQLHLELGSALLYSKNNCQSDISGKPRTCGHEENSPLVMQDNDNRNDTDTVLAEKEVSSFRIDNFKDLINTTKSEPLTYAPNQSETINREERTLTSEKETSFKQSELTDPHQQPLMDQTSENKTKDECINSMSSNSNTAVILKDNVMIKMHQQYLETADTLSKKFVNEEADIADKYELQNEKSVSDSSSGGFSIFAEPIDDTSSVGGDSNTQSMIDRSQFIDTDLDADTDTESQCKDYAAGCGGNSDSLTKEMPLDYADVYRMKSSRNTMSSASSQASIDFLDHIPFSRREIVRRRRQALSYIFTFLDTVTLCRTAEVCREWKIVSRNPKLWTRIELCNDRISGKFLSQLARRCTKLRLLILKDLLPRNRRKAESVEEYTESTRCSLETGLEQILKRSDATLISLSIINCGHILSSKSLWAASCYSRMLTHITYLSDVDPINAEVMWALGSGCRDITSFKVAPIYPCQKPGVFNTKCVQLIGKCFRDLKDLSIGGYEIDLSALTFVSKCCQRLEYVELNHMAVVTKSVVKELTDAGLNYLREIRLIGTPIESSAVELFYSSCKHLQSVEVQLTPDDYFQGTKQPQNTKLYEEKTNKLRALCKKPGLGKLLKLTIQ